MLITAAGSGGIYERVQMEVTGDLSRGLRPVLQLQDCGAFLGSYLFGKGFIPENGQINECLSSEERWGGFSKLGCFFFLFLFFSALGSKCHGCSVQASHPGSVEWLQVRAVGG